MPDDVTTETTDTDAEAADAHRRRTIIRLLVGLGIGIPVLIELATFVGLIEQSLLGEDDGDDTTDAGSADGTGTDRTTDSGVRVGDDLLPETPQRETLSVASFRAGDESWVLTLATQVENTGTEPYTVQFGPLTTQNGRRVEGTSRATVVAAGETEQVTGTWQLQPGDRPETVVVRTSEGDAAVTEHEVNLARIPLEGTRP